MDIISFLLGYASKKGGGGSGNGENFDEVDKILDEINGEVIGESLCYVSFLGADGRELHREPVYEGYDCPDPVATNIIETPTKASTVYENYTFSGWSRTQGGAAESNVLSAIEQDLTLYAAFTAQKIYIAQGSCGTNAKWAIDPDYKLVISGSGNMTDYTKNVLEKTTDAPWWDYHDRISSVYVENGITKIGNGSFAYCSVVTVAFLADSVTNIGYDAFWECALLINVNIPAGVSGLFGDLFFGCASLPGITIPAKISFIGGGTFTGCASLTSVVFENPAGWSLYNRVDSLITSYTTEQMSDPMQAANILVNNTEQTGSFKRTNT